VLDSDISGVAWKVNLDIFQDETYNKLGGFGISPASSFGVDALDDYNPPSFQNSPEINFDSPDPRERMCQSMVGLSPEFVWRFTPGGRIGELTELTWSENLGSGVEQLFMVDEAQARVIEMRQQNNYTFKLGLDHRFSIYFGINVLQKITTSQLVISSPFPNPLTQTQATFNLGLPDTGSSYRVNLQVFSSAGVAVTNHLINFEPGIHSIIWQPDENRAAGMYFYRIAVHSGNTNTVSIGKIILP
jgi:hypothetical protein